MSSSYNPFKKPPRGPKLSRSQRAKRFGIKYHEYAPFMRIKVAHEQLAKESSLLLPDQRERIIANTEAEMMKWFPVEWRALQEARAVRGEASQ